MVEIQKVGRTFNGQSMTKLNNPLNIHESGLSAHFRLPRCTDNVRATLIII